MKREITLGQLLAVATTLLIALATGWVTINKEVTKSSTRIDSLEFRQDKTDRILERIEGKVELILIKLENKKDR